MLTQGRSIFHDKLQVLKIEDLERGMVVMRRNEAVHDANIVVIVLGVDTQEQEVEYLTLLDDRLVRETGHLNDMGVTSYGSGGWHPHAWVAKHPEDRRLTDAEIERLWAGDRSQWRAFDAQQFAGVWSRILVNNQTFRGQSLASTTKMVVYEPNAD